MTDPRTVRLVALLIGLVALIAVAGSVLLLATDRPADAALAGLAGTALGYLAGFLTPTPSSSPQPVRIEQRVDRPVPVKGEPVSADAIADAIVKASDRPGRSRPRR